MVVVVEAGVLELGSLRLVEHPEGHAGLEPEGLHPLNHLAHTVELRSILHLAPGCAHAEAGGPVFLGYPGLLKNLPLFHETLRIQSGGVVG